MIFRARFGAMAFLLARLSPSPRNPRLSLRAIGEGDQDRFTDDPDSGQLFAPSKSRKPDGRSVSHTNSHDLSESRAIALNLGGLIADGFIARKRKTVSR